MTVPVRYFAAARAAACVETEDVDVPPGATVDILLKTVRASHGDDLVPALDPRSSCWTRSRCATAISELHDGALVDVPAFAAG